MTKQYQALWLRLSERPGYTLGLSDSAKHFVWECIIGLEEVTVNDDTQDISIHPLDQRIQARVCSS